MGNTLYIGIDPSMSATGCVVNMSHWSDGAQCDVFPATHFHGRLRFYFPCDEVVVAIEYPKKTDGNRKTGKGNTRVVCACAAQMVKDLEKRFPLRGEYRVKSRVIYKVTPETWRLWAYGPGKMSTEQAKAAAVALTGIEDHNIAEAAILCKLGEWWSSRGFDPKDPLDGYTGGFYCRQWLKGQFESEVE